jgi:parallel beta-helix repeat protein
VNVALRIALVWSVLSGCVMAVLAAVPAASSSASTGAALSGGLTYHIDFQGGSDARDGLSPQEAWKHCPGDPAAEGKAKAAALQPGDTVLFKGGVTYRGNVSINVSGAEGRPIVFDGNSAGRYGEGRAIIDGSEVVAGWQPCTSAQECGGNPNWKSICWAWLDAPIEPLSSNLYEGDKMCWVAQDPNPKDPFYQDRPEGHRKIRQATASTITDPQFLTQPEANAWEGAWMVVYASPNYPYFVKVTAYDPAAHELTHSGKLDGASSYAVLNSLRCLDQPGEYVVRKEEGRTRIFLWPHDAAALAKSAAAGPAGSGAASVSRRGTAFVVAGQKHVEIRGFTLQKFCARDYSAMGIEISKSDFVAARDNDVRFGNHGRTGGVQHGAGIAVEQAQDVLLENNRIVDNRRCCGVIAHTASRCVLRNNVIRRTGYVGIWLMKTTRSEVVGNTITDNHGVHSNAISVYVNSADILVAGNRVLRSDRPLTLEESNNIAVIGNALVSDTTLAVGLWSGSPQRNLLFLNNLILGPNGEGLYAVNKVVTGCTYENNIMASFMGEAAIDAGANTFRNNLYLKPQQALYHPSEKHAAAADLFVDPAKEDYHLKPGSPAVDGGADVGSLYPKAAFPDYDFGKDGDGRPRKQGPAVDIGPYELPK